jgi:hypothetical protein
MTPDAPPCACRYWIIIAALLATPFVYNPLTLHPKRLLADIAEWELWVSAGGLDGAGEAGGKNWAAWWDKVTPAPKDMDDAAILGSMVMSFVYGYLTISIVGKVNQVVGIADRSRDAFLHASWGKESWWQLSLGVAILLPFLVVALFDTLCDVRTPRLRAGRNLLIGALAVASFSWYLCVVLLVGESILGPDCPYHGSGAWWRFYYSMPVAWWHALVVHLFFCSVAFGLTALQVPLPSARWLLKLLQRARDYALFAMILVPLGLLALCGVFHYIQSRIVFQPTPVFFTRGPRGSALACAYFTLFIVILVLWILYLLLQLVGQAPVALLNPFMCS